VGPGFFYYHRGPDGPQIRRALLLLAISGLLAFALYSGAQMRPLLGSLATTRVSNAVNRIVYQAVNEAIDSDRIAYEQLVSYEKDNEGRITMVRSNMAAFNRLQSQILDLILSRIDQVSARELSIPAGSLTGSPPHLRHGGISRKKDADVHVDSQDDPVLGLVDPRTHVVRTTRRRRRARRATRASRARARATRRRRRTTTTYDVRRTYDVRTYVR